MSVTEMSQRDSQRDLGVSHTTPTRPDPTRPLYQWSPFHTCRHLGNAQRVIGALDLTHLSDGMDAATRRRFA